VVAVSLHPELPAGLAEALAEAGLPSGGGDEALRLVAASVVEGEDVAALVGFVLGGGALLVCGGEGPLLDALHLSYLPGGLSGVAEPHDAMLSAVAVDGLRPVSGVGYALYTTADGCAALAGPRGRGWVGLVGEGAPADLVAATALWISRRMETEARYL